MIQESQLMPVVPFFAPQSNHIGYKLPRCLLPYDLCIVRQCEGGKPKDSMCVLAVRLKSWIVKCSVLSGIYGLTFASATFNVLSQI